MGRLLLRALCAAVMLTAATVADARGTYHHAEPYVEHSGTPKPRGAVRRVIVYSPDHNHYHLRYDPQ
jgi:hypothetical protein